MACLQVGRALGCVLGVWVWVWGQQFQSPMFQGTQPPYATKASIRVKSLRINTVFFFVISTKIIIMILVEF